MTTPKELTEIIRNVSKDMIDTEVQALQFEHGWILRRVTSYVDKDGKARVAFNFEVRLEG